jgi:lactoylglutathione lyase
MMFDHMDYVMIMVSDMSRSVPFYRDQLGIPLKFESPEWSEFETGTTVLALHGGGKPGAMPSEPKAGTATIGFYVKDLEGKFNELKRKGVVFTLLPTDRGEEGIKLAVCLDPDGLPISIAERKR